MPFIGNQPALSYTSFAVQHFTTSATTSYTLDYSVANENEIRLVINNVVQQPGSSYAYTASGTTLTLSAATSATDTMYAVFLGKAVQTVTPASGSVTNAMLGETITVANGGTGLTSGFKNGITMADQWRISADTNTSTNADITTNWERVDDTGWSGIGTGMTESSGIFSFPSTGIYLINFQMRLTIAAGDGSCGITFNTTVDNSSYTLVAQIDAGNTAGTAVAGSGSQSILFDVTDISTHKIKFATVAFASGTKILGNTAYTRNGATFTRLGDT